VSGDGVELVVRGDVLVAAEGRGVERAEALAIGGGRIVAVGEDVDVRRLAGPRTRVVDARGSAILPGLHDFHVHLVALARSRAGIDLDDAADGREVEARLRRAADAASPRDWITGRGWSEAQLAGYDLSRLEAAVGGRAILVRSHDGHSAWASAAARAAAGITAVTPDPPGGRIERDAHGEPTGILRETALELAAVHEPRLQGPALRPFLDATVRELSSLGITGATEAGDYTDENGVGPDAALGDSASTLIDLADAVDGRLRLTVGIPADAIAAAAERGLSTGQPLAGTRTLRFGWAKEYADGALGSGTAALFEPRTCGDGGAGILRLTGPELDAVVARGRAARIGLAVHAIGDRAAAHVLDAVARGPARGVGVPPDRMEHLQLVRSTDRARIARLRVTASIQPIHAAADRDLVEACWDGRQADAYAWRALRTAGAVLAAGSDAPIESVDPWLGVFAAVHRRFPDDGRDAWRPEQSLTLPEALNAYTLGPARAIGADDEGHLRIGAKADLVVLSVALDALLGEAVDFRAVRSEMTIVDGAPVA
jgi:predicted amidohydrolase YtcJ